MNMASARSAPLLLAAALAAAALHPAPAAARSPPSAAPPARAVRLLATRDFGAVGDGVTDNTLAFEAAVAAAAKHAAEGGAELVVPGGVFLSAPFNLTSNFSLRLEAGATLRALDDFARWPVVAPLPTYGTGRDHAAAPRRGAFLGGEGLMDVAILGGNGTIDGAGQKWWDAHRDGSESITRGHLVEFINSTDILLHNTTFANSPFWTIHPYRCKRFVAKMVSVISPFDSPNTDGIDPDSTEDVLIEDFYCSTGDDCVAIKSGWDCAGRAVGAPSQNIVINNIWANSQAAAGVTIGSEMSGGVRNVTVSNARFVGCKSGFRIKSSVHRGAYVQNINVENVWLENVQVGIQVNDFYGDPNPICVPAQTAVPNVSDILLSNVRGRGAKLTADLEGLSEGWIGITLRNISLDGSGGWYCAKVRGVATDCSPAPCDMLLPAAVQMRKYMRKYLLGSVAIALVGLACVWWRGGGARGRYERVPQLSQQFLCDEEA